MIWNKNMPCVVKNVTSTVRGKINDRQALARNTREAPNLRLEWNLQFLPRLVISTIYESKLCNILAGWKYHSTVRLALHKVTDMIIHQKVWLLLRSLSIYQALPSFLLDNISQYLSTCSFLVFLRFYYLLILHFPFVLLACFSWHKIVGKNVHEANAVFRTCSEKAQQSGNPF